MSKSTDLTGKTFDYWTVLHKDEQCTDSKHARWICRCKCGNVKSVIGRSLTTGRSKSCGCRVPNMKGINFKHGMSGTRLYRIWAEMRLRCSKDSPAAKYYRDKGIRVCNEWDTSAKNFFDWAFSSGYNDSLTIDRIDNSKGYCPENCRWVTMAEQQANKTSNIYIVYNGEKCCLRQACRKIGFPYKLAHQRYSKMKKKVEAIDLDKLFAPVQAKYHTNSKKEAIVSSTQ